MGDTLDAMRPSPYLRFLRPYAWGPLEAPRRNPVYLRFYHLARHQELARTDALRYPRIQHDGGVPMRIPAFRAKYAHIEHGTLAEDEVVLRGRVQFVRRVGSKLVFLVLRGEFEQVQAMVNLGKLEAGGATLDRFRDMSRLLNRGDIVCA